MIYFIIDKYIPGGSWPPVEEIEQLCTHDESVARAVAFMRWSTMTPLAKERTVEYYLTEMDGDLMDPRPISTRWKIIKRWK